MITDIVWLVSSFSGAWVLGWAFGYRLLVFKKLIDHI